MFDHEPMDIRWNPKQSIASILISIVSLLAEPNLNSLANPDAGTAYRKYKETKGLDSSCEFLKRIGYSIAR